MIAKMVQLWAVFTFLANHDEDPDASVFQWMAVDPDAAEVVATQLVLDWGPQTCRACGRVFPGMEGMVGYDPYCHPADSIGPTCYSRAASTV